MPTSDQQQSQTDLFTMFRYNGTRQLSRGQQQAIHLIQAGAVIQAEALNWLPDARRTAVLDQLRTVIDGAYAAIAQQATMGAGGL